MKTSLEIPAPVPFDFVATACSHGWVVLAPNAWDEKKQVLRRVERLHTGKVVSLSVTNSALTPFARQCRVQSLGPLFAMVYGRCNVARRCGGRAAISQASRLRTSKQIANILYKIGVILGVFTQRRPVRRHPVVRPPLPLRPFVFARVRNHTKNLSRFLCPSRIPCGPL